MDTMMLPVVVRGNRWFWFNSRGSYSDRWRFILQQLLALAVRSRITTLELVCVADIALDGLGDVLALCPGLLQLHVHSNGMLGPSATGVLAGMLGNLRLLTRLALRRNGMGGEGVRRLAEVLPLFPVLARLDVSCNELGVDGTLALAPGLAQCAALSHLDVGFNHIGEAAGESLGWALAQCAALTHLDLAENGLSDLHGLGEELAQCAALTHVILAGNELSGDGVAALAEVLSCSRLQFLDLRGCVRAHSLAEGLGQCTSLTELKMDYNRIQGPVAVQYARALQGCMSLARLDLRGNEFNMHATAGLSGLLPQYAALVELRLPFNSIRVLGARVLLAAAAGCAALRHLDLHNNYIRDEYRVHKVWPKSGGHSGSFLQMLDALSQCTALTRLNLSYNDFSDEAVERLLACWGGCAGGLVLDDLSQLI